MPKNQTLDEFYSTFREEVLCASDTETSGWTTEDFLTNVMMEYLEEAGEVTDPVICPFRGYGLQMNAYAISEDCESVDIFVSIYSESDRPRSVSQADIDAAIKRAIQLYHKAINDLYTAFQKDNDTYEFAITLHQNKDNIKHVRICALTNGLVKPIALKNITIGDAEISFSLWDVDRLYRCVTSGKMRETIEIDFEEKFQTSIPCIENNTSKKYSVYLAIINGDLLAALYDEFRNRLLEKNVRSFLQVKGGVNKGIRDTLRDEPDMFLAYNNGISVTAESVEIVRDENGKPSIKRIRDMQIVNGGQTTASIFNAKNDRKIAADLSQVFVQMKISVIHSADDMDEIVPRISTFANTQNKIQVADFSANDPFHRRIEELSRTIWAPAQGGMKPRNWFYERARGQYADMLTRESTTKRKKEYKETHPLFTKTDLAKYENTWDQLPWQVSEGAQKNFHKFMLRLKERKGFSPDEIYYQNLIAKAILFRQTEKLVQKQQYGGYRANIVTYTLAFLSFKTAQRIDLDRIWKEQALTPALEREIIDVSKFVQSLIVNPPGGANVGEWCKKEKCWQSIRDHEYTLSDELQLELLSVARPTIGSQPATGSIDAKPKVKENVSDEECFFQCKFKLFSEKGFSPLSDSQRITQDEDYQSNQLLYRNVRNYAIGHGCAADWDDSESVLWITTAIFPKYDIKPIVPSAIKGVSLDMLKMSPYGSFADTIRELRMMCAKYREWINGLRTIRQDLSTEYKITADRHITNCETCLSRMEKGVELLEQNENIRIAFQYMNLAMLMQQLHYNLPLQKWEDNGAGDISLVNPVSMPVVTDDSTWHNKEQRVYGKWRPFQLAFVLMNLRAMYDRDCNERGIVDLIWFPTGGGKTEAYLGLSAYTIFIRRLMNKDDKGTAILMRYTSYRKHCVRYRPGNIYFRKRK